MRTRHLLFPLYFFFSLPLFSQKEESKHCSRFFIHTQAGAINKYEIKKSGTDYGNSRWTAAFGFGVGFDFRIRDHFYFLTEIDSKSLNSQREGIDSSYYSTGGIVGYSNYNFRQHFQSVFIGLDFPFYNGNWTFCPGIKVGIPIRTKIKSEDLTTRVSEKYAVGPSIWTYGFSMLLGYTINEKISVWSGYNFIGINYNSLHSFTTNTIPAWSFSGKVHSLDFHISFNFK